MVENSNRLVDLQILSRLLHKANDERVIFVHDDGTLRQIPAGQRAVSQILSPSTPLLGEGKVIGKIQRVGIQIE